MKIKNLFFLILTVFFCFAGCEKNDIESASGKMDTSKNIETAEIEDKDITKYDVSLGSLPTVLADGNVRFVKTKSGTYQEIYVKDEKRIVFAWAEKLEPEFKDVFESASLVEKKEIYIANELTSVDVFQYDSNIKEPLEPLENLAQIPKKGEYEIRWEREGVKYYLFGTFSPDKLLQIAQSISYGEESITEKEDSKNRMDVQSCLQSFPEHITGKFSNQAGDSCLFVDADIVIPDKLEKLYIMEGQMKQWSTEDIQTLTAQLLEKKLITEEYSIQTYTDEQERDTVSLGYANERLLSQEKQGEADEKGKEVSHKQLEDFVSVWKVKEGAVALQPYQYSGEAWDRCTYSIHQTLEGMVVESDFPATVENKIVNTGGQVTFGENQISSFDMTGLIDVQNKEECSEMASVEQIKSSLQKAVNDSEIIFSEQLKAVRMELVYLAQKEGERVSVIPVWNFVFDTDSYYQYLEKHPGENGMTSMLNLCINIVDGRIAYAM